MYKRQRFSCSLSEQENLLPIAPSECSIIVDLDRKGNVTNMSENAGMAVPNASVAGYMGPNTASLGQEFVVHDSGYATCALGRILRIQGLASVCGLMETLFRG